MAMRKGAGSVLACNHPMVEARDMTAMTSLRLLAVLNGPSTPARAKAMPPYALRLTT